jgi:hypothetical protein
MMNTTFRGTCAGRGCCATAGTAAAAAMHHSINATLPGRLED